MAQPSELKIHPVLEIPCDWQIATIGDIADVKGGKRLPKGELLVDQPTPYPYIRVSDMVNGGVCLDDIRYVPEHIQKKIAQYTISRNDLFISVAGTLGIIGFVPESLDGANLTENANKITNIRISQGFLYYVLSSEIIQNLISAESTNNAQPKLALTRIKAFQIPVPPRCEQQKIASILSAVDNKLDLIDRKITATRTLKKGLMQRLFSQGIGTRDANGHWQPHTEFKDSELGRIPAGWDIIPLFDLATVRTGVAKGKTNLKDPISLPYLRVANVKDGYLDLNEIKLIDIERSQIDRYLLQPGDVLMTEGGDLDKLGRGDIWSGQIAPCLHQNHVFAVRCNASRLLPSYLSSLSGSELGKKYFLSCAKQTTNLASINSSQLKAFSVLLPPLEEQRQIMAVLTSVNRKIDHLSRKKNQTQHLKKGLMQKLLTGQLRVTTEQESSCQ